MVDTRKAKVKTNTATLQIRLPIELRQEFNDLCSVKNINSSELIRQLITNWINKQRTNPYTIIDGNRSK